MMPFTKKVWEKVLSADPSSPSLRGRNIGTEGARNLAELIAENKQVIRLDLEGTHIGPQGAEVVVDACARNDALKTLHLQRNGIGDEGAAKIAFALEKNFTLTELELEGNAIEEGLLGNIRFLLQRNKNLQRHMAGIQKLGVSFYIKLKQPAADFPSGRRGPLEWHLDHIREVAMDEYGAALPLVKRVLEMLLRGTFDNATLDSAHPIGVLHIPSPSAQLLSACSDKKELSTLVNSIIDGKSNLLHLTIAKYRTDVLSLCKFLVEELNADFDTAKDKHGRTAREIGVANRCKNVRTWSLNVPRESHDKAVLFSRYKVEKGAVAHKSATSSVEFAEDVTRRINGEGGRQYVALKLVNERIHFEHELQIRLCSVVHRPGEDIPRVDNRFDEKHVVRIDRYFDYEDASEGRAMCFVMPKANRSMDDVIRTEGNAGFDIDLIKRFAREIAEALDHMHSVHMIVHADVKPRNIVQIGLHYKLIDLSTAVKIGDPVGPGKRSTGYCPPELAKVLLIPEENTELLEQKLALLIENLKLMKHHSFDSALMEECENDILTVEKRIEQHQVRRVGHPKAHPTFDVWSYGVVMYHVMTGSSLFNCDDEDNLQTEEDEQRLFHWKGIGSECLEKVLNKCRGATAKDIEAAKALLTLCLNAEPDERPQTMTDVLCLSFFHEQLSEDGGASATDKITVKDENLRMTLTLQSNVPQPATTQTRHDKLTVFQAAPLVWRDELGELQPLEMLDFDRERDSLFQSLEEAKAVGGEIELNFQTATKDRLSAFFSSTDAHALHFTCHGYPEYICLEDGSGGVQLLTVDELRELVSAGSEEVRLVVVSACYSRSVGEAFVKAGVQHVVCCQMGTTFLDDSAMQFSRIFYGSLARGNTLRQSFEQGRQGLTLLPNALDADTEMNKFLLLPEGNDHDIPVFYTKARRCTVAAKPTSKSRSWILPRLSQFFIGREMDMYNVLQALSQSRFVRLTGCEGIGRSALSAALSRYIQDRANTFHIDEVIWLPLLHVPRTDKLSSCFHELFKMLVSVDLPINDEYKHMCGTITETLCKTRALAVIDAKAFVEMHEIEKLSIFLEALIRGTKAVKVILVCQQGLKISFDMKTTCLESEVVLKPLRFKATATLFGEICPYVSGRRNVNVSTPQQLANLLVPKDEQEFAVLDMGISNRSADIFRILGEGVPARIHEAAQGMKPHEYDNLIEIAERPLMLVDCKTRVELDEQLEKLGDDLQQAIRKKNWGGAKQIQDRFDELETLRETLPNVAELRHLAENLIEDCKRAENLKEWSVAESLREQLHILEHKIQEEENASSLQPELPNDNNQDETQLVVAGPFFSTRAELESEIRSLHGKREAAVKQRNFQEARIVQRSIEDYEQQRESIPSRTDLSSMLNRVGMDLETAIIAMDFEKAENLQRKVDELEEKISSEKQSEANVLSMAAISLAEKLTKLGEDVLREGVDENNLGRAKQINDLLHLEILYIEGKTTPDNKDEPEVTSEKSQSMKKRHEKAKAPLRPLFEPEGEADIAARPGAFRVGSRTADDGRRGSSSSFDGSLDAPAVERGSSSSFGSLDAPAVEEEEQVFDPERETTGTPRLTQAVAVGEMATERTEPVMAVPVAVETEHDAIERIVRETISGMPSNRNRRPFRRFVGKVGRRISGQLPNR